ncbi:hypothetical protein A2U01_0044342, partial [Trifolium medium]|nr:hypothetical protein [Trifolium medium]
SRSFVVISPFFVSVELKNADYVDSSSSFPLIDMLPEDKQRFKFEVVMTGFYMRFLRENALTILRSSYQTKSLSSKHNRSMSQWANSAERDTFRHVLIGR